MTEWIDVPVADVQVGDGANLDGIGAGAAAWCEFHGGYFYRVARLQANSVEVDVDGHLVPVRVRRASIVSARRRKPEPSPKPGNWDCSASQAHPGPPFHNTSCRVYRASSGWSKDTRDGQPWVMQEGAPVNVTIPAKAGSIAKPLEAVVREVEGYGSPLRKWDESLADYYKRIGLDVRSVDRRKR